MNAKHNLIGAGVGALLLVSVLQITIAQSPSQTDLGSGPGAIRLLPDYHHRRTPAMDTSTGYIWKDGGPEIQYEIGDLAINRARLATSDGKAMWDKTIMVNLHQVQVVMTDDETLIVSFAGYLSHFVATRVKTKGDVVDVMLMLMTYDPLKGLRIK